MEIGIGLPSTIPGVKADQVVDWAKRAEAQQFSSLAVLDRLVYRNWEPLVTLAAAAAVTDRIGLVTSVLIGPYRGNAALLAKQLATIDQLSERRLVVGMAVGARDDDYIASGVDFTRRGDLFESMLDEFDRIWPDNPDDADPAVVPDPEAGRPTIVFGGSVTGAFERAATRGEGWIMGGGDAAAFSRGATKLREAWASAGRTDQPRTLALAYYALGPDAVDKTNEYLTDYYAFLGDTATGIANSAVTTAAQARQRVSDFADAGCGELLFIPCSHDPDQVDMLSEAVGARPAATVA